MRERERDRERERQLMGEGKLMGEEVESTPGGGE